MNSSEEFVQLHNHTLFSTLDGIASPADYFKACAERKWPALAITEHGVLNSIPDAYLAAKEYNIKYIPACEFYYQDYEDRRFALSSSGNVREWRKSNEEMSNRIFRNRHLVVLAKNEIGYANLLKINLDAWNLGFYRKPRVRFDFLAKHKEGLIILSGCLNSPICHEIRQNNLTTNGWAIGAIDYVRKFKKEFGDDFYIELQMPGVPGDVDVFSKLIKIADHFKIKTVLTNDCHYMTRDDHILQKVMMAIDQQTHIEDPELFHVNSDEQFFKTRAELRETFLTKDYSKKCSQDFFERTCDNTLEIADKCGLIKLDMSQKLPKIDNAENLLVELAEKSLKEKGLDKDETEYIIDEKVVTHTKQMRLELKRIIEKGYATYFIMTKNLIDASKKQGMPIGPGRGSSGGSLVCYLLGIVSIDPLLFGLSFNRMLSPARGGDVLKVTMDD